jgi:hypothetical protein
MKRTRQFAWFRILSSGFWSMLLSFSCSDFGSEPWMDWSTVDLPGAQIRIPNDMQLHSGICDPVPCNPFWRGKTAGGQIDIELDYYYWVKDLALFRQSPGYWEYSTLLGNFPSLCFGCEHQSKFWNGDWHYIVGVQISGLARPDPLTVYARLESRADAEYATQILKSIKGKPGASFYGGLGVLY